MTKSQTPARLPEIAGAIYDLLEPLDGPTRSKILQGVLGLLGEGSIPTAPGAVPEAGVGTTSAGANAQSAYIKGPKALAWMKKHGITDEVLEQVFAFGDQIELIVEPPGKSGRARTLSAYVLIGAQHFLQNDEPRFSEAEAVALCKRVGCHDGANHAQTRASLGNRVTGTKDSGYTLTVPGLGEAASIIKSYLTPA